MKQGILLFLYAVFFAGIQGVWPVRADFFFLAVLFLGFYEDWLLKGFLFVLGFGFFMDSVSYAPLGTSLFPYLMVFSVVRFLRKKIEFQKMFPRFVWVFLLSILDGGLRWMILFALQSKIPFWAGLVSLGWQSLIQSLLAWVWIPILNFYYHLGWGDLLTAEDPLLKR